FAADFLQIPPHGGHPCLKLMTTTAFAIRDLHPIDNAHAGRHYKKEPLSARVAHSTLLFLTNNKL
ncbi:hypothetical protein, partial [Cohnella sp.]|uniref:hypothetical protein n=1 Tax=Cohnella sp. TaxID=1883426 RepID=UPI003568B7D1